MGTAASTHYGSTYFSWQSSIGAFGGWANRTKFEGEIRATDRVIDFGCGGGYLLAGLTCADRVGVEINPVARAEASTRIPTAASIADVADGWADIVISNHALEHCERPLEELVALRAKLKPGGKAVFVVPCESIRSGFFAGDINQHLYTWSPLNLGNLFLRAGFEVESCLPYRHKWPPHYLRIAKYGGRTVFDLCARVWAAIDRTSFQVRIVARRPA